MYLNNLTASQLEERRVLRDGIWAKLGYTPNKDQLPIHLDTHRTKLVSGGEGGGKSYVSYAEYMAFYPMLPLVYLVGPKYQSCYPEFDYISEGLLRLGRITKKGITRPSQGPATLTTADGCTVQTISSEDGTKAITGTGKSPDAIFMVEAGKQSYEIYLACRARVSRARGFLFLSGTIERSERWYPELIDRWSVENPEQAKSFILPTWTNTALYPGGETDPEILALKATFPADVFLERFGARPCPPSNLVLKEFKFSDHVSDKVVWDRRYPIEIWVDPGYSGSHYAVLFVQIRHGAPDGSGSDQPTVWVIDEIYANRATTYDVIKAAIQMTLWKYVKSGVGDTAVKQHAGLPSHLEIWKKEAGIWLRNRAIKIEEGILVHRSFLSDPANGRPRIFFNPKCKGALGEYGKWVRKEIGEQLWGDPEKINCDALKAINYGLVDNFGFVKKKAGPEQPVAPKPLYMQQQFQNATVTRR